MIPDSLEVRKNEQTFLVIAHPFYPIGADDPDVMRFRPMIYEIVEDQREHVKTLDSEATSDEAIQAGFLFVKAI